MKSPTRRIDQKIRELGDWRGQTLAELRDLIREADPEIVEEWKWAKTTSPGTPVFSRAGIVCTGETYKNAVKMTFAKGAVALNLGRKAKSKPEARRAGGKRTRQR